MRMSPLPLALPLLHQFASLLLLSLPVACVSWTVTHEEVFREPREFCKEESQKRREIYARKFFYLFTCEYCFSHYVTAMFLFITDFQMLYQGWRGFVISELSLVWIANIYMSVFNRLRLDIKHENVAIVAEQTKTEQTKAAADR
jgi:hypothetical protein